MKLKINLIKTVAIFVLAFAKLCEAGPIGSLQYSSSSEKTKVLANNSLNNNPNVPGTQGQQSHSTESGLDNDRSITNRDQSIETHEGVLKNEVGGNNSVQDGQTIREANGHKNWQQQPDGGTRNPKKSNDTSTKTALVAGDLNAKIPNRYVETESPKKHLSQGEDTANFIDQLSSESSESNLSKEHTISPQLQVKEHPDFAEKVGSKSFESSSLESFESLETSEANKLQESQEQPKVDEEKFTKSPLLKSSESSESSEPSISSKSNESKQRSYIKENIAPALSSTQKPIKEPTVASGIFKNKASSESSESSDSSESFESEHPTKIEDSAVTYVTHQILEQTNTVSAKDANKTETSSSESSISSDSIESKEQHNLNGNNTNQAVTFQAPIEEQTTIKGSVIEDKAKASSSESSESSQSSELIESETPKRLKDNMITPGSQHIQKTLENVGKHVSQQSSPLKSEFSESSESSLSSESMESKESKTLKANVSNHVSPSEDHTLVRKVFEDKSSESFESFESSEKQKSLKETGVPPLSQLLQQAVDKNTTKQASLMSSKSFETSESLKTLESLEANSLKENITDLVFPTKSPSKEQTNTGTVTEKRVGKSSSLESSESSESPESFETEVLKTLNKIGVSQHTEPSTQLSSESSDSSKYLLSSESVESSSQANIKEHVSTTQQATEDQLTVPPGFGNETKLHSSSESSESTESLEEGTVLPASKQLQKEIVVNNSARQSLSMSSESLESSPSSETSESNELQVSSTQQPCDDQMVVRTHVDHEAQKSSSQSSESSYLSESVESGKPKSSKKSDEKKGQDQVKKPSSESSDSSKSSKSSESNESKEQNNLQGNVANHGSSTEEPIEAIRTLGEVIGNKSSESSESSQSSESIESEERTVLKLSTQLLSNQIL